MPFPYEIPVHLLDELIKEAEIIEQELLTPTLDDIIEHKDS